MKRIFTHDRVVADQDIDIQERVNNVCYVQWMQDVAVAHSAAQGWSVERYVSRNEGWVVRRHAITYKRPAVLGDVITVATWIAELASRQCTRRYLFWRATDQTVLAEAETLWVYIDTRSGHPIRVVDELREAFAVVPDDTEVRRLLTSGAPA